jgi:hypothetical protein
MNLQFDYYLDAWNYCRVNGIDIKNIRKLNFRKWYLSFKEVKGS